MTRRHFLATTPGALAARAAKRRPAILLRSSWQTVNIGDIAHTPGVLAVLEKHIPEAELIHWPVSLDRGTEPMLLRRFPKLRIAKGNLRSNGTPDSPELRDAFEQAGILIHGSAAGVSASSQMVQWSKTRKPYGFFGVGFTLRNDPIGPGVTQATINLLNNAAFVYTRETASLANLGKAGIKGPDTGFAPDGTFSMDILDEPRGEAFLKQNGLEPGRFICVIPRLRFTPYHQFRKVTWSEEEIRHRTSVNEKWAEQDHAKLREVVIAWVRKTGQRVLLCPEMTYQLDVIGPLLYNPLPADVKRKVVRRTEYWLPDEASSVYKRAVAVVSFECHSPILAASHGTPCIYAHQPEDGIKGHMWEDVGLKDWYFEIEQTSGETIARRVLEIGAAGEASRRKVRDAVAYARRLQGERAAYIRRKVLGLG